jgi:hypothetical protein
MIKSIKSDGTRTLHVATPSIPGAMTVLFCLCINGQCHVGYCVLFMAMDANPNRPNYLSSSTVSVLLTVSRHLLDPYSALALLRPMSPFSGAIPLPRPRW